MSRFEDIQNPSQYLGHITFGSRLIGSGTVTALCGETVTHVYLTGGMGPRCPRCVELRRLLEETVEVPVPNSGRIPSPEVDIQHRCPQMRLHVVGPGRPGTHPRSLPVPCGECYSLVTTSVRIPFEPSIRFTVERPS